MLYLKKILMGVILMVQANNNNQLPCVGCDYVTREEMERQMDLIRDERKCNDQKVDAMLQVINVTQLKIEKLQTQLDLNIKIQFGLISTIASIAVAYIISIIT